MKLPFGRVGRRFATRSTPILARSTLVSPRSCLLLVLVLLGGCARERPTQVLAGQVRVDVTDVAYDHSTGTHYLVLEEKAGRRVLPITIGDDEARAILFELHGIKPDRPLTYELLLKVIQQTGNHVDRVLIGEVREEVYYATVYLDHGRYELDSRPSDAVALAIGTNAPIFVADKLLQAATDQRSAPPVNIGQAAGITVQELTPELAQYFGTGAHSGVLIADLAESVQKLGVARGDIVTQIEGREISSPQEFIRAINDATSSGTSKVVLTLNRNGKIRVVTVDTAQAFGRR